MTISCSLVACTQGDEIGTIQVVMKHVMERELTQMTSEAPPSLNSCVLA